MVDQVVGRVLLHPEPWRRRDRQTWSSLTDRRKYKASQSYFVDTMLDSPEYMEILRSADDHFPGVIAARAFAAVFSRWIKRK